MTKIEYIQSSGAQWIDTLFTPDQDTSIELKIRPLSGGSSWQDYYGSRQSSDSKNYEFQRDGSSIYMGYGSSQTPGLFSAPYDTDVTVRMDKNVLSVNGSQVHTFSNYTFTCPYDLVLFGLRNNSQSPTALSKNRLYYCKIWNNVTLVRDFIPVTDGNAVACLYDQVAGTYYYNSGSGTFEAGPPIQDTYSVVFHANNGSGSIETQMIPSGEPTALLDNAFSYRFHEFLGWDTSSAGTTVVYTDGQTVTDIAAAGGTANLYAVWDVIAGYLISDATSGKIYAVSGGALSEIVGATAADFDADFFKANGFQSRPDGGLLLTLSAPVLYSWGADAPLPMTADLSAVPYPQPIKTAVDLSGVQITGIQALEATYSGNVNACYSYDDASYTAPTTLAAFLATDKDALYAGLGASKMLYIKFILTDENATLTSFKLTYKRRPFTP